jgi:hypothetical protein
VKAHELRTKPIACTLDAGAYQERLAWVARINRSALRSIRREGARLILTYDPQASTSVREMIRLERKCCAFLRFKLHEDEDALTLVVVAPKETRGSLDSLFEPFLTGQEPDRAQYAEARK